MTLTKTLSLMMLSGALVGASTASAQNARVQIIHNSADAAAATVDIYVNDVLTLPDVAFRTATGFLDLPAETDLAVGIAPGNSTGAGDIIATFNYNLADGGSYIIVANGIVSATGYSPVQAFDLDVFPAAREAASMGMNTDVLVIHGSTDAPVVDVAETSVPAGTVVDDLAYGSFAGYLELGTADYVLEVQTADGTPVAAYQAPLETLGLDGAAITVVASGFLAPANNSNGAAFGLWVALPSGGPLVELPLAVGNPTARVQIIHNSADAAAAVVDIYVNDEIAIEDVAFRTATEFLDLPAETDLAVGIAPGNSTSAADIIATFNYNLADGGSYIIVANGIVSPTGYSPVQAFDLDVFPAAREAASMGMNTDVLVIHGSTDAPIVDVAETSVPAGTVVDDLDYGSFAGYLELGTADYVLEVQTADGTPVAAYEAPLGTLGLDGAAITVVASGFLAPANNSNGAAFGLWVALPSGGPLVELPLVSGNPNARVQIIHNSADAAAAVVDIYVNDEIAIEDVAFRTATEFLDLPAETDLAVGIAPGNSTSAADIIATFNFNLDDGGSYIIVANGIVSPTGYTPAQPFTLDVFPTALEAATVATNTDVLVMHGSTDAPVVDVAEISVPAGTVVNDLAYGSFAGYLELATADYAIQVQTSTGTPVATYSAPLSTLGLDGAALTVLASGFLAPANNSNGPAFGLYVALPAGGDLIALPLITNVGLNEADDAITFSAWPNPANDVLNLNIDAVEASRATVTLTDMTGRTVLGVPSSLINAGENRLTIDLNALSAGLYTLSVTTENGIRTTPIQVVR